MPDLTLPIVTTLVAVLTTLLKRFLPEDPRDRWTPLIALALGTICVCGWVFTRQGAIVNAQSIADAVIQGLIAGLSAVGVWNTQNDFRKGGRP